MIRQGTVRYKDTEMSVRRWHCASSSTAEVSGIPASFKPDTLVMLFENSKRSGGGKIDNIDYVPASGRALITFNDPAGVL